MKIRMSTKEIESNSSLLIIAGSETSKSSNLSKYQITY